MKTIGIFYGSSMGNTKSVAETIAAQLNIDQAHVYDISKVSPEKLGAYDLLLFGSSTWGIGDLQDDWDTFIPQLKKLNLSGKFVAVFGTGDSASYSDSFCDAIGTLVEIAEAAGATIVGKGTAASEYSFDESKACKEGIFYGLPLDVDNESNKTTERISRWIKQIQSECSLS